MWPTRTPGAGEQFAPIFWLPNNRTEILRAEARGLKS
jgi:hypothetical protein